MNSPDPFDLTGRIALVTGASRGIGAAIALALAARGARLLLSSRKAEGCEETAAAIRAAGGEAHMRACHVGELDQIDALWAWVDEHFGRIDVLVNNAGTNPMYGSVLESHAAGFQKVVDVNFRGYWFMTQHGARRMAKAGGGSIINIASVTAEHPMDGIGAYGATKAAVVNLTQAFARECGPLGVRVNAILPGLIKTRFAAALQADAVQRDRAIEATPLRRIGEPEDIAGAAVYFAADASRHTTGATLRIDGGMYA
jgi:NAD(P)-dependent dehydrogenase (short-subunit alcohol dehydrogenase family)